ncbi:MAG: helix-turn-helix transcriptional regulator [Oscillospiraceae bacterium]|nr:helix-turn-helix transcriptional regulator [Oscillospiraceae bacterium]
MKDVLLEKAFSTIKTDEDDYIKRMEQEEKIKKAKSKAAYETSLIEYKTLRNTIIEIIEKYIVATKEIKLSTPTSEKSQQTLYKCIDRKIYCKEQLYAEKLLIKLLKSPEETIEISYKDFVDYIYISHGVHFDMYLNKLLEDKNISKIIDNAIEESIQNPSANINELAKQALVKIIGIKIRQIRKSHCHTYDYLSTRIGISVAYLNKIEKGALKEPLTGEKLYLIKFFYDCSWHYLLGLVPLKKELAEGGIDFSDMMSPLIHLPVNLSHYDLTELFFRVLQKKNFNEKKLSRYLLRLLISSDKE